MQIQNNFSITKSNHYYNQNNLGFRGELGQKVVEQFSKVQVSADEKAMSVILKSLGLGSLGVISMSKFKDIMAETSSKFALYKIRIEELLKEKHAAEKSISKREAELDNKRMDFDASVVKKTAEMQRKEAELEKRTFSLNVQEENIKAHYKEKLDSLEKKEKTLENEYVQKERELTQNIASKESFLYEREYELTRQKKELNQLSTDKKSELDKREAELNKREKQIETELREKITSEIHEEEKQKAEKELADKKSLLDEKEQHLAEKERALIHTEYLIKDAEKEKLMSDFRVLYGIEDISNAAFYNNVSEQIYALSDILDNNHTAHLEDFDSDSFTKILETMRNRDGALSGEMLKFVERTVNLSDDWNIDELLNAINIVKDDFGNVNTEKASAFIAFLLLPKSNMDKAVDKMLESYKDIKVDIKYYTIEYNGSKIQLKRRDFDRYNDLKSQISEEKSRINDIIEGDPTLVSLKNHLASSSYAQNVYNGRLDAIKQEFPIKSCKETIAELEGEIKKLIGKNAHTPEQLNALLK